MRWPSEWIHPSALELVRQSPVNCILVEPHCPLTGKMREMGLTTLETPPAGVSVVKGEWPGIPVARGGDGAGPTGRLWIDSNGWRVRLARVRQPERPVWVVTEFPKQAVLTRMAYLIAVADAAMYGGSWVIELDAGLARAIERGEEEARRTWKNLLATAGMMRPRTLLRDVGIVGILSDFAGGNEFTAGELLNLTGRLQQPYRILEKAKTGSLEGFQAIVYADAEPPASELRRRLLEFVRGGGLLVAGAACGITEGRPGAESHRNYTIRTLGAGRIAVGDLADPYQAAADTQVLLSHRHDLVRFWNGSALGSYLTEGLLQVINYAGRPGADPVTVRIAGPYREARIQQLPFTGFQPLAANPQKGAIELHLPEISVYAAIELI